MSNLTIILPVHELNDSTKEMFKQAIISVGAQTVAPDALLIVAPKNNSELISYLKDFDYGTAKSYTKVLENEGNSDFSSQLNYGVDNTTTEWFCYLEFDDILANHWVYNVVKYRNAYTDVDIFLPIILNVSPEGQFSGLLNEAVWAHEFCDEKGILDQGALLRYENFSINGAAIKTEFYKEHGGMKPSIKLMFTYEFLLRMTQQSARIMTIPRLAYQHMTLREGSLFKHYLDTMTPAQSDFWRRCAKKEYLWPVDRNIKYEVENV
jgi:hypothetical protein